MESMNSENAIAVFWVIHIIGVVKVQDWNEARSARILQAAKNLVGCAQSYPQGWQELRSPTNELQRKVLQVRISSLHDTFISSVSVQVQVLIATHVNADASLECDGSWGQISNGLIGPSASNSDRRPRSFRRYVHGT